MKTILVLLLALLGCAGEAQALGRLADVQVYDRTTGTALPVYAHSGRYYVAGEPGHEYQIAVTNRDAGRVMAVGSVDGVNVISGETAGTGQNGYVLAPWQSMSIAGWRKSMDNIAAFYFTRLPDSYAARTGRPDDVGVIGVALFREKQLPCCVRREDEPWRDSGAARSSSAAPPASDAFGRMQEKDERLGTGHGRIEESQVTYTEFARASSRPDELVAIYYDSYSNLCKQGVIAAPAPPRQHRPRPFPGGFTPDP